MASEQPHGTGTATLNDPGYRIHFAVPTHPAAAGAARRVARDIFTDWHLDLAHPAVDTAIVILSELVANTARHTAILCTQADITLSLTGTTLGVAVHDRHPLRPAALHTPHGDDTGGWGLRMIRDLTDQAGGHYDIPADPDGNGKTIRINLPVGER